MVTACALLILCAVSAGALQITGKKFPINVNAFYEDVFEDPNFIEGFTYDKSSGHWYRLEFVAQPWRIARRLCEEDQAKLAIPKTESEFRTLQSLVRQIPYSLVQDADENWMAWLGIHYNQELEDWMNLDGVRIKDTGYHQWAGNNGQNSSIESNPHCAGVDPQNAGLRDYWCLLRLPYICQRNYLV